MGLPDTASVLFLTRMTLTQEKKPRAFGFWDGDGADWIHSIDIVRLDEESGE